MATSPKPTALQVGDRVRERRSLNCYFAHPTSANYQQIRQIASQARHGSIVDIETRTVGNGRQYTYLRILWDGASRPTSHARQRIELAPSEPAVADTLQ